MKRKRICCVILAVLLSLQGSLHIIAASEQTESSSEIKDYIETESESVYLEEVETESESVYLDEAETENETTGRTETKDAETEDAETEDTWVLDEDSITFTVGTPSVEFVENTTENIGLEENTDYFNEEELIVGTEEFDNTETTEAEINSELYQTDEFYEDMSDSAAILLLSAKEAWVLCQTEEKTMIPVVDNQIKFTDFSSSVSSSVIEEVGYSLCLDYSRTGEKGIKAGDEFLLPLPAQYLDYEEVPAGIFIMEDKIGQKFQVGDFKIADNELSIIFNEMVEAVDFTGGQGYIELRAKLKQDTLFTKIQARETAVVPEMAGDCVVQTDSEITLTFPVLSFANGIEQTCELDEERGIYIWRVTAGTLTPDILMTNYSIEDMFDTDNWNMVFAESDGESLSYEEMDGGIRLYFPEGAAAPYTIYIGMQPISKIGFDENTETELTAETEGLSSDAETTSEEQVTCTNTVRLSHIWLQRNDQMQWESTETYTLEKEDLGIEKDEFESEAMSVENDMAAITASETIAEENAVVPPLEDWWYELFLDRDSKTGEITKAEVILHNYNGDDEIVSIPETYTVDGISYNVTYKSSGNPEIWNFGFENTNVRKVIFPAKDIVHGNDMRRFFDGCTYLQEVINLDKQVTYDVSWIFYDCTSLIDAPKLPSSAVDLFSAFKGCTLLKNVRDLPSSTTYMEHIFYGCISLESAPILPNAVTDLTSAFAYCTALVDAPEIPESVTNMFETFKGCESLVNAPKIPASVTDMGATFRGCKSLISAPEIPESVTNMCCTFSNCVALQDVPEIPVSVKNMGGTFENCKALVNAPKIWASATYMDYAFSGCESLTDAPEIPITVTNMSGTFENCKALMNAPKIPLSVVDMTNTFFGCKSLKKAPKIPLSVSKMEGTFRDCDSLMEAPDIPESVVEIDYIFRGCENIQGKMAVYCVVEDLEDYYNAFLNAATNDVGLIVDYCEENAHVIDDIIATASGNSNIIKGECVAKPISSVAEEGEYLLRVTDTAGEPLANVEVVYGLLDACYTNKKGEVTLRFTDEELAGVDNLNDATEEALKQMYTLTLTKEEYLSRIIDNYVFDGEDTSPTIRLLKPDEEALVSATLTFEGTDYDILEHDASIDISGAIFGTSKTFFLQFETTSAKTRQYSFAIRQGNRKIAESDKEGAFQLNCDDFKAGQNAYLDFIDKTTLTVLKSEKLRLSFIDSSKLPSKIELGSSVKIHIDDNIPLLGGNDFSLGSMNFPIEFSIDGTGKVRVGVNIEVDKSKCGFAKDKYGSVESEKKWSDRTGFFEKMEKLIGGEGSSVNFDKLREVLKEKDKYTCTGAVSIAVNFGGYLEGTVSDLSDIVLKNDLSSFNKLTGSIFGEAKVKVSSETGFFVFSIPCVCAVDGSGSFKTSAKWNHGLNIHMEPKAEITLFLGAGCPNSVSGGGYGKGEVKVDYLLSTFSNKNEKLGLKEMTLSGDAGLMLRVLGKELIKLSLINGKYVVYRAGGVTQTALDGERISLQEQIAAAISDADTTVEVNRDYLDNRSAWEGKVSDGTNEVQVLQSSTYIDTQPAIQSTANGRVMVWLDDLGHTRNSANRTAVVYSIFDDKASSWSEPRAIEDDNTADFSPMVYSDGTNVYIIWQDAKKALTSEMTLTEQAALMELNTAKIDVKNNICTLLGVITDNSEYEMEPALSMNDGILTAHWYINNEKNPLGAAGKNTFYSAVYNDGIWVQSKSSVESGIILTRATASFNGMGYTATGEDMDMDLTTADDRRLYLCADSGNEKMEISARITGKVCSALIHGMDAICWTEDDTIRYIMSSDGDAQVLLENSIVPSCDYQIFGDRDGNMSIVYLTMQDNQTQVMVQSYDPIGKTWGEPVVLVNNGKYIEQVSGYYENGKLILVFSQTEVTDMESLETVSDFCYLVLEGQANLTITGVEYDKHAVKTGNDLKLTVTLKNSGSEAAPNAFVNILDGDGKIVGKAVSDQSIAGGSMAELTCNVTLPQEKGAYRYTVQTDASTYEFTVGQGRLLVLAEKEEYTISDKIAVHVRNIGLETISGKLELFNYDNENEIYYTENIPELNGGDTYLFRCQESSLYTVTGDAHTIGARVTYDGGENTDFVVMNPGAYTVTFEQGEYGNNEKSEVKVFKGKTLKDPDVEDIIGWYLDEELTTEWNFDTPVTGDMTLYAKWDRCEVHQFVEHVYEPTCTGQGYTRHECLNCNYWYYDDFVDAVGHHWESFLQEASCEKAGKETTKCTVCGAVLKTEALPKKGHIRGNETITKQPSCATEGVETVSCTICGAVIETKKISPKGHMWSNWIKTMDATVFSEATESRTCSICGQIEKHNIGSKVKPILKLTANSLKMKTKQSTTKFGVVQMAAGDFVKSVVSSNKKILRVSSVNKKTGIFKLKAQGKKGTAKLTITLASGVTKTIKVKVQTAKVTTSKITVQSKKIVLKKGQRMTLKPIVTPVTSQDKMRYTTSNKKVAKISSKGVITAVKKGKAKITIKSGKKKVICSVTVR